MYQSNSSLFILLSMWKRSYSLLGGTLPLNASESISSSYSCCICSVETDVGIQTGHCTTLHNDKCALGQFDLCCSVVVVQLDQLCWIPARFSPLNAPPVLHMSLLSSTSQTVSSNLEIDIPLHSPRVYSGTFSPYVVTKRLVSTARRSEMSRKLYVSLLYNMTATQTQS